MGASFYALIPSNSEADMAYSYVHTVRAKLVKMVDAELGELFAKNDWKTIADRYNKVIEGLTQIYDSTGDDVVAGVLAFVDHSDCDGDFYTDDCEDILKALKKLSETDDDIAVENLIKVFSDAVNGGGIVTIW